MSAAATKAKARDVWPDAKTLTDAQLDDVLNASWVQCLAWLPTSVTTSEGFDPSAHPNYVTANVLAARDLWAASKRADAGGASDLIGVGDTALRARPLSDVVRGLLVPPTGRPVVG